MGNSFFYFEESEVLGGYAGGWIRRGWWHWGYRGNVGLADRKVSAGRAVGGSVRPWRVLFVHA